MSVRRRAAVTALLASFAVAAPAAADQYLVLKNGTEHLGRAGDKDRFITCRGAVLSMRDSTLRPTTEKCPSVRPTMPSATPKVPSTSRPSSPPPTPPTR